MRSTRSTEKRKKEEEGIVDEPKPKVMSLGKHLALIRQKDEEDLLQNDSIAKYEQFLNYSKTDVILDMAAEEVDPALFRDDNYFSSAGGKCKILFLTLAMGSYPSEFTHFCNNTSLKWNLKHLNIKSSSYHMGIPSVLMLFVRGQHVTDTTMTSDQYKYMGLVGVQSMTSGMVGASSEHIYLSVTLVFDYALSRKELLVLGNNVMKCKKNKYGCSLCAHRSAWG